jgi:putative SbcD/Mre11-related phosphoesterase
MASGISFVTGYPALMAGKALVVSDLHLGIEHRYRKEGIALPSQSERLLERLRGIIEKNRARRLIVLGDVKHKVPGASFQEEREVPAFFRSLAEFAEVEVTPGNHDDGLGGLLPTGVTLHPSAGIRSGDAWLCHGHAWPPEEFLDARHVVTGHNHAGLEFRDSLGYRWIEPVWVRAGLDRESLSGRYRDLPEGLPEFILMPPLNEFAGLMALNSEAGRKDGGPNPLFRSVDRDKASVYMLDGTLLGRLQEL